MSGAQKFYRLQLIDSHLEAVNNRLKIIAELLDDDSSLKAAEQKALVVDEELKQKQKELRLLENQVRDQHIKIEQNASALYGGRVQNPKELQDLQNESASLKRYVTVLEDRQLEAMIVVEEAEEAMHIAASQVEIAHGQLIEQHAGLKSEQTQLLQDQQRLEVEHQATNAVFTSDELALYEKLRKTRRGLAVVRIADRNCSACGSTLTPAVLQEASTSANLVLCPTCGRILFTA
jgi:predicted  nucleic acid-binding Zn-ribbon protein